jgi:oligoribonuclease
MKYLSIDLETTGLDANNHQILEFGAVFEDTNNIQPMEALPTYHAYIVHPNNQITGDIYALDLNKDIINKLKNKKELEEKYNFVNIEDLADDFLFWLHMRGFEIKTKNEDEINEYKYSETLTVAGKNFNSFDKKFLDNVPDFSKKIRIRHRVIDPSVLFVDWKNDTALPSLDECKQKAGIEGVVTHLAVDDAKDVIELLRKDYV